MVRLAALSNGICIFVFGAKVAVIKVYSNEPYFPSYCYLLDHQVNVAAYFIARHYYIVLVAVHSRNMARTMHATTRKTLPTGAAPALQRSPLQQLATVLSAFWLSSEQRFLLVQPRMK